MTIARVGRREALRAEMAPAFRALLEEAIPSRTATRAVAAGEGVSLGAPERARLGKTSSRVRYLNKVKDDDGIVQPSPARAWELAETAMAFQPETNQWCEGALFLFGSGHLGEFAQALLGADERHLSRSRKRELVVASRTAVIASTILSIEQVRQQLLDAGFAETLVHDEIKKIRKGVVRLSRPDRNVWHLTPHERLALKQAFIEQTTSLSRAHEVAVTTAQLAAANPGLGIDMTRDITVSALCHALSS